MCDHCSKVTGQKGYSGQVTCKCEHGDKKNGEGKDKDYGGCCSKNTYKPLLDQRPPVPYYPPTGPGASLPRGPVPYPAVTPVAPAIDTGCCSWARDCCGGGCCAGVRCCAPPEPIPDLSERQSPLGYGCGPQPPSYNQPRNGFPSAMDPGCTGQDEMRVPCVTTKIEPKFPKCFGGDCQGSEDGESDVVTTVQSAA